MLQASRKKAVADAESLAATKNRLERIVALQAIQEATRIAGQAGTLDFDSLEKQVRDLETQVDAELAFHEEMWKEDDLDSVLKSLGDTR